MKKALRVLLLEDSAADFELIAHELRRSGMTAVAERVDSKDAFVTGIRDFAPDVVLSDHSLADFDARAALHILRSMSPTTPLLIVTGSIQGDRTVACLRAGAQDLILKSNLSRLPDAITGAITIRRPLEKLTRRQIEVLRLVAEGHRTRAIANQLKLSVKTVESHRGEVMKRLGIHDVVSLVRYAVRIGLISAAD
jgi:DNA-binding NarL/FixJ family response regulator